MSAFYVSSGLWYLMIAAAAVIDFFVGDPDFLIHPTVLIGKLVSVLTGLLNRGKHRKIKGLLMWIIVMGITGSAVIAIQYLCFKLSRPVFFIVNIWLLSTTIAFKSLKEAVKLPVRALENNDLKKARVYTGYIVGRDTKTLSRAQLLRAIVESGAENTIDGVLAPIMAMVLGLIFTIRVPLFNPLFFAMLYKAINTMDSMVGYTDAPYTDFGFFPARFDDIANYIPARIGSFLMLGAGFLMGYDLHRALAVYNRDRYAHASPNGGHPEAAVAGLLGVQLGGNNTYFGNLHKKPTIGNPVYPLALKDAGVTVAIGGLAELELLAITGVIVALCYCF